MEAKDSFVGSSVRVVDVCTEALLVDDGGSPDLSVSAAAQM